MIAAVLLPVVVFLVAEFSLGCEFGVSLLCPPLKMNPWESNYRIPNDTLPLHYDVYLYPNLEDASFSGKVQIEIDSKGDQRDHFIVHTQYLNITDTSLIDVGSGQAVKIKDAFEYEPNQFWVTVLDKPIGPGIYSLSLAFEGRLDKAILGFYKSVYTNKEGQKRTIATSKFQPTYARRAFPCMDEPTFKSTFTTTLVRPSEDGYMALSNMPEESSRADKPSPGLTEVTFQKSVPMVTYLAIFVVCDFSYIDTINAGGNVPMRVFGTDKNKPFLSYAAKIAPVITDFYQEYFDIEYPLPKLDMAAIPDYSSGATEHWGLITFRETNLVLDPKVSSFSNKVRVADVIAHELAHQWFGNLMTVKWWNDLWLNEGFAVYIEYKGVKSAEPSWDTDSKFLLHELHNVMDFDATLASHPVVVDVDTPDQINAVFDIIAYSKGASVIRMIEDFLGPAEFRQGLHNFLVKHKYQTAVTKDLMDELSAVSSEQLDVEKIVDTWTRQKGYPVLTLAKDGGGDYHIRQERFLSDSSTTSSQDAPSQFNYKWEVPVTYISSEAPSRQQKVWFNHTMDKLTVSPPKGSSWVKFNVGQLGYYRVNYPHEDWEAFGQLLLEGTDALSTSDRTSLINDAFALAQGDRLPYSTALNLIKFLKNETKLAPWSTALSQLKNLAGIFYHSPDIYPTFVKFVSDLVRPIYDRLGWKSNSTKVDDDYDSTLLQPVVIDLLCTLGDADCLKVAATKFHEWQTGGSNDVPEWPDLKAVIYCHGMAQVSDFATWNWMLDRYKAEANPQEKLKMLKALTCIRVPWILSHFLELAKDESVVRSQDYFSLLTYMSWNRVGQPLVWDFLRTEWNYLVGRFTLNDRIFGRFLASATQDFNTELRLKEMREFFEAHPEAGAGENYRKVALETVQSSIRFLHTKKSAILQWLEQNVN